MADRSSRNVRQECRQPVKIRLRTFLAQSNRIFFRMRVPAVDDVDLGKLAAQVFIDAIEIRG